MSLKDARTEITIAISGVFAQCPEFRNSGLNPELNWIVLLADDCDTYDMDINTGCSERDFVRREDVNTCLATIYSITCANALNMHFLSYGVCASSLKSDMILPMMFF